jgi:hypothetical protein
LAWVRSLRRVRIACFAACICEWPAKELGEVGERGTVSESESEEEVESESTGDV